MYREHFVKAKLRTNAQPDDVLTIDELAAYLKIPKTSLYKLVRAGKIPAQTIGRHWRFGKRAIEQWLQQPPRCGLEEAS